MMFKKVFSGYPFSWFTMVVVVFLSIYKFREMPEMTDVPLADKWVHMLMYGGFSFVLWFDYLRQHRTISWLRVSFCTLILPILLGGLMEGAQALIPYRSCDVLDFVANVIGSLIVYFCALVYVFLRGRRVLDFAANVIGSLIVYFCALVFVLLRGRR